MKKAKRNVKHSEKLKRTLGILSSVAIGASLFMGYNRLTGNVISSVSDSHLVSFGGIALFVLGILGIFFVARD